jgi:cytoskeletal protein RodZ
MVATTFTRKKVGSMTLGERFRKIRSDRRISLREVSRATKIQVKYLEAIEAGTYDRLPAEVYVKGFLRSYAGYLGVPEDAILKLYARERHIQKNLGRVENFQFQPTAPVRFSFVPSPKVFAAGLGILVTVGFFSFLSFELRTFVSEPRLVIESPTDGARVEGSDVLVSGQTDPRAEVYINGESAVVDEVGAFSERLTLSSGLNEITVSSTNRFGKIRERVLSVDASVPDLTDSGENRPLANLEMEASIRLSVRIAEVTTISVVSDEETVWNGEVTPGDERSFSAMERVVISASSGSAVAITYEGGAEEMLSSESDPIEVEFGPEGRIPIGISDSDVSETESYESNTE